jgi:transposase
MATLLHGPLSDEERAALVSWQRSPKRVPFLRARTILLAEHEGSATDVARALGLHAQTVRETLRRFEAGGLAAIEAKPHPGRPRVFGDSEADVLIELLHDRPVAHGGPDERWTLATVARALAQELDVPRVGLCTVRRLLKRRRFSWQRAKEWLKSPDPRYAFKKSGVTACSAG